MVRDFYLDFIKSLLVILVILGHVVQYSLYDRGIDFDNSIIFTFIYSFHMPLFMFVSGCLFSTNQRLGLFQKSKLLLLPFFVWAIIKYFLSESKLSVLEYLAFVTLNPDVGLWFLWVLFWSMLITHSFRSFFSDKVLLFLTVMVTVLIYLISFIFGFSLFGLNLYAWQSLFFVMGLLFYKNKNVFFDFICHLERYYISRIYLSIFFILLYCVSYLFWERDISNDSIFNISILNMVFLLSVKYLSALSFIMIVCLSWGRSANLFQSKLMLYFSSNSLAFYAIQFVFIDLFIYLRFFENIFLDIIFVFFATTFSCAIFIYIINKAYLLRVILFGR